jgi:hypothetical protein
MGPGQSVTLSIAYAPGDVDADDDTARLTFDGGLEAAVHLVGSAVSVTCDLEVTFPPASGVPGQDLGGVVGVSNRRTDAGCLLARLVADPGCDEGFTLLPTIAQPFVIPPRGNLLGAYRFTSQTLGVHTCTLRAIADDPEGHEFTATGQVDLSWRPCLVYEGPAAIPAVSPSCGPSPFEAAVRNVCGGDFTVGTVALAEGSDPAFTVGAIEPAILAPNQRLGIPVAFNPSVEGDAFAATIEVRSPLDPEPWTFPLSSSSGPDDFYNNRYVQKPLEPIDVLVVIDNATGMGPEVPALVRELEATWSSLPAYDYHLAVTTTGLVGEGSGCPGGANGGEDGRWFPVDGSRPRVVTPATPEADLVWMENVQVGTCRTGPSLPLAAAARALSPALDVADDPRHPEANDGNAGFLRAGVPLVVVVISDRDDESPEPVGTYLDAIVAAKNGDPTQVSVVTIAGDPGTGCTGLDGVAAGPGNRLHEFAAAAWGIEISICEPAWGFANLFTYRLETYFPVSEPPADRNEDGRVDEADLEVWVGAAPAIAVPPLDPGSGATNWTWNPTRQAIGFSTRATPPAGSLVRIQRLYCGPR